MLVGKSWLLHLGNVQGAGAELFVARNRKQTAAELLHGSWFLSVKVLLNPSFRFSPFSISKDLFEPILEAFSLPIRRGPAEPTLEVFSLFHQ